MSMRPFNARHNRRCAFCRHWYDPANAAIRPKYPKGGLWEFDDTAESLCQKSGHKKKSSMCCSSYACKV